MACGTAAAGESGPAGYRLLKLDGVTVKWGAPALGSGATVTYALVAAPTAFPGARNCAAVTPLDALLHRSGVSPTGFETELAAAFAAWSRGTDIEFRQSETLKADILIGAEAEPRGRAFTNVTRAPAAGPDATAAIVQSVICLNPTTPWKIGFDGDLNTYDLRYALEHEIGHAIGLDHPGTRDVLMDFRYTEGFREPQAGDLAGADRLYGAARIVASPPSPFASVSPVATAERGLGP